MDGEVAQRRCSDLRHHHAIRFSTTRGPTTAPVGLKLLPQRVLVLGSALTPFVSSQLGLIVTLGLLTAIGSGACSFSVLLGAVAQCMPATSRGTASGIINAGSSFGQFVFAPIIGKLIQWVGWMNTMWAMAAVALLAIPMLNRLTNDTHAPAAVPTPEGGLKKAVSDAIRHPSYFPLTLGCFTFGFTLAFLRNTFSP